MNSMIRKTAGMVLAAALAFSVTACKDVGQKPSSSTSSAASVASEVVKTPENPTLGNADTEYDGFQYLYPETLATESKKNEETQKMENESVVVYLPKSDYASVQRTRAYVEKMGMEFTVDIQPYFQYEEDDYTLAENLDYYLELEYDPDYMDFAGLEVGKAVEDKASNSAQAVVSYCKYDIVEEKPAAYFCTYSVKQLESGLKVLVSAEISSIEATGKLPELLDEIESFYGFRPEWDSAAAEKKLSETKVSNEKAEGIESSSSAPASAGLEADTSAVKNADGTFTVSNITFSLPAGWEMQEEGEAVFAPDGDSAFSGCAIMVMQQYNGATSSDLSMFSENPEILEALLQSYMESSVGEDFSGDMEFKVCEKSPFGMAIKMSMGSDGTKINAYFIFDEEGYMSVMMSLDTEADLPAAQALETLFASVKRS